MYAPEDERPFLDIWFRDAQHGYAVGAYGLFMETSDGGASWTDVSFAPQELETVADTLDDQGADEANDDDAWYEDDAGPWTVSVEHQFVCVDLESRRRQSLHVFRAGGDVERQTAPAADEVVMMRFPAPLIAGRLAG